MNKKNISPEPGLRIRRLREKLGLSRAEFSKITGMSASTMRSLEVGDLELAPSKALLYSHMFVLLFEMDPDEASADVLLYGEQRSSRSGKKTIIIRKG
jgi:transcriptional regulator with XRE-family HTH domain